MQQKIVCNVTRFVRAGNLFENFTDLVSVFQTEPVVYPIDDGFCFLRIRRVFLAYKCSDYCGRALTKLFVYALPFAPDKLRLYLFAGPGDELIAFPLKEKRVVEEGAKHGGRRLGGIFGEK